MNKDYFEDEVFERVNYSTEILAKGEYERCRFLNCDFQNADIASVKFSECIFESCNLSMAELSDTAFRDIEFKDCKMLGLRFDTCNQFGLIVRFFNCTLNHSSFYKMKLKKTIFRNSHLLETDFADCDLTEAVFERCDLSGTVFVNSNIEKADFRTAVNYSIDLELNKHKKAKFSYAGIEGLLAKYDIQIEN